MRYRLGDIPHLLLTPLGRMEFANGVRHRLWPLRSRLARHHRSNRLPETNVIAIVGSFGKTTTTRAVTEALDCRVQQVLGMNCWNHLADALLRVRKDDQDAVFEVGIDGVGQMEQYARMLRPNITVVTSIGSEHLRSLGDLSVTRHEKAYMIRALSNQGVAVLNGDDENVRWMAEQAHAKVLTYGFEASNDVSADDVRHESSGRTSFRVKVAGRNYAMTTPLIGRHMLYPLLAATAVVHARGLELEPALSRLREFEPTPGRMHPIELGRGITILRDDYKSSLETVNVALDALAEMSASRKVAVLGEVSEPPGSQGPIYREIGGRLAAIADLVIVVGPNYQRYASGAASAGMPREVLLHAQQGVLQAAEMLGDVLRDGDLVLIKGRDTQRLERISCVLQGRSVRCDIDFCPTRITSCSDCPMLGRGWAGRRVVI